MYYKKLLGLALIALSISSLMRADQYVDVGTRDELSFSFQALYDDDFQIINVDTNQTVASVTFLNNQGYYSNQVYDSDDYYCSGVSVDSYCNPDPWAFDGSAYVTGLPYAHYAIVSHESQSGDAYENIWGY